MTTFLTIVLLIIAISQVYTTKTLSKYRNLGDIISEYANEMKILYIDSTKVKDQFNLELKQEIEFLKQTNEQLASSVMLWQAIARYYLTVHQEQKSVLQPDASFSDLLKNEVITQSTFTILENQGLELIQDLTNYTKKEVSLWRNVGDYQLAIIAGILQAADLDFKPEN